MAPPQPPPPPPSIGPLFSDPLPLDPGSLPAGLASASAQGCNACHFDAHDRWAAGPHARSAASAEVRAAAAEAGTPACLVCHLPLLQQQDRLVTYDAGDVSRPVFAPNPDFDATLHTEGVTCVACHVRGGAVVAGRHLPEDSAPHPLAWTEDLGSSQMCGACHQLTWPGASTALYDTFESWRGSAYAEAGIGCTDCHLGAGASDLQGRDHSVTADPARAVSLLLDLPGLHLTRGGPGLPLVATLQNTGAGHHAPTGSPFVGWRLQAWLEGPPGRRGEPARVDVLTADLKRTLMEGPPWDTVEDTRLPPGGASEWSGTVALEQDAPAGPWVLRVSLAVVDRAGAQRPAFLQRSIPLDVD